jgi:hypothetical protein
MFTPKLIKITNNLGVFLTKGGATSLGGMASCGSG